MAIRFVDKEPETAQAKPKTAQAKPKAIKRDDGASEPATETGRANTAPPPLPATDEPDSVLPGLAHAKPSPKPRGRKAPSTATDDQAGTTRDVAHREPAAPRDDGLLPGLEVPGLQVHAKPTPKPRGRKKAFG